MDSMREQIGSYTCDIPRLSKCCFAVPLTVGVQFFAYVSTLDCLVVLYALADLSMHDYIDCSERRYTCLIMSVDIIMKSVQLGLNIIMLWCICAGKYHKMVLFWAWYTLTCAVFTVLFFRSGFESVEHEPDWTYYFAFGWDLYGSLVAYSYYRKYTDNPDGL